MKSKQLITNINLQKTEIKQQNLISQTLKSIQTDKQIYL